MHALYILYKMYTQTNGEKTNMSRMKAIMNLNGTTVRCHGDIVKFGGKIMTNSEFSNYIRTNYPNETGL